MTSGARKLAAGTAAGAFFCLFLALGTWQVERREWKLALIGRVETRVHARPVSAPPRAEWPQVKTESHEYRHVSATGVFLPKSQTRVQALTELGAGFWLMTPLRMADGGIVLVNRGFVSGELPLPEGPPGTVTVTGLLRMPEPGGGFLRRNEASANRWYSRDVQAIADARAIGPVAPYFIDADVSPGARDDTGSPVGGLTVIAFHNNHLIYAVTWYTLAFMIPAALWHALRPAVRAKRP